MDDFSFSRNTPKHDACLKLLVAGYTQSYCDLFYLSHRLKDAVYGPGGELISAQKPVETSQAELDFLCDQLTKAEAATRIGEANSIFMAYIAIAKHFESCKEWKLAVYFHEKSLHVSRHSLDKDAEGGSHASLAYCYEQLADLEAAIDHHERHLRLAKRAKNLAEEAKGHSRLFKVYERQANLCEAQFDWAGAVKFHGKCKEIATEIGDEKQLGQVELRLGLGTRKLGRSDVAVKHFESYLDTCVKLRDNDGACVACHNLARTYKEIGDTQNAVEFLERLLELSQQAEHRAAQGEACSELGTIYNNKGDYTLAMQYFEESFDLSRTVGKQDKIESARVQLGVAKGNSSLEEFMAIVKSQDPLALQKFRASRT